jgi:hypothetical protein
MKSKTFSQLVEFYYRTLYIDPKSRYVMNARALRVIYTKEETNVLTILRSCSSIGRAPVLSTGGSEFDPPREHAQMPERLKGTVLRSVSIRFAGSNPALRTSLA